ncbi:MAG: LacI family DNA-binding transcriptional regulator [Candidatus Limnocylindrales bacterium]
MGTTMADVAARVGVSTATVSRILSGALRARPETRARVFAAVEELGYRPSGVARSLKLQRTRTIGLIITDVENPFFAEIVRAVEDAAVGSDYAVVLCNGADDPEREAAYLEILAERRVDGIIVASGGVGERHARWLARAPLPVVMMNSELSVPGVPTILSDNRAGGRLAAEHLVGLGHRTIGHIGAPAVHGAARPRLAGIRDGLAGARWSVGTLRLAIGDGHVAEGERAMARLLRRSPDLSAVICYNDLTAIGALRALRASGRRVPEDVSVVGFDGLSLAGYVDPPLTTVAQATVAMSQWAVRRLIERIDEHAAAPTGAEVTEIVRLPVRLVVRGSTGPAAGPR